MHTVEQVNEMVKRAGDIRGFESPDYNWLLNEKTGVFVRWGQTKDDDPIFSPYGPELVDMEISTICSGPHGKPCPHCSPLGTLVNTPNGFERIEKLKKGDLVLGFNVDDNSPNINEINELYSRNYDGKLIDIETDDGKFISITPNHEVLLSNGKWLPAGELKEGDDVIIF